MSTCRTVTVNVPIPIFRVSIPFLWTVAVGAGAADAVDGKLGPLCLVAIGAAVLACTLTVIAFLDARLPAIEQAFALGSVAGYDRAVREGHEVREFPRPRVPR